MPSVRGIKEENERLNHDHTQLEGREGEPADSRQGRKHSKDQEINFNFSLRLSM